MCAAEIAQLIDADRTDEDGAAEVGGFSIILTDKNGTPIFNSEIVIDVEDKISIKLPGGRLLDFADQTTITAFFTESQKPAADLNIFIEDANGNKATGKTDTKDSLKFPIIRAVQATITVQSVTKITRLKIPML